MPFGYAALCSDFVINSKLKLTMDLPTDREATLGLFERIRRAHPSLSRLRRFDNELALESRDDTCDYHWVALRTTSLRATFMNPDSLTACQQVAATLLECSPYFLSISSLDIASLEVSFGFDLEAATNRNEVIVDALLKHSPLSNAIDLEQEDVLDFQPSITVMLDRETQTEATIEVRPRVNERELKQQRFEVGPLTIDCTVRQRSGFNSIESLPSHHERLLEHVQQLVDDRVIPRLLLPIRDAILSRPS